MPSNLHVPAGPLAELAPWTADHLAAHVASGGLPPVPGSGTTLPAFATTGYVLAATGALVYVQQAAASVGPLLGGDGLYWLALHRNSTTPVSGWTRQRGTHYITIKSPSGVGVIADQLLLCSFTVASGAITTVTDYRVPRSYILRGVYSITDPLYGAVPGLAADATPALRAALQAVAAQGGGWVEVPAGTWRTTSALTVPPHTTLAGAGRRVSVLAPDHTGNALQSSAPVNVGPTGQWITLRDLGIDRFLGSHPDTGVGYADVAGAFLRFENVFIRSSHVNLVFDQSEHVLVNGCEFITNTGAVGVWLVNDDGFTATALPGFTNLITITDTQFNAPLGASTAIHLLDDGGANHNITNNNFNAGAYGIRAANTAMLRVEGNFFEGQTTYPLQLAIATLANNTFHYSNATPAIRSNSFSTTAGATYHISLFNSLDGAITDNSFVGSPGNAGCIVVSDDGVSGVLIEGNAIAAPPSTDIPMIDATTIHGRAQRYRQRLHTSQQAPVAASGNVTLHPRRMGAAGTTERVQPGEQVLIENLDGARREITVVTSVTADTITVENLVNSYDADFLIHGASLTQTIEPYGSGTNYGTAVIPSGSTTVVVLHDLGYIPLLQDIVLFQAANTTMAFLNIWVNTITSTQFTINVAIDPGASGLTVGWRIFPSPYRR